MRRRFRRSCRLKRVESSPSIVEAFDEIHVRRSLSKLLDRSRSSCLLYQRIVYDVFQPSSIAQLYPTHRIRESLSIFRPTDVLRSLELVNTEKQKFRSKRSLRARSTKRCSNILLLARTSCSGTVAPSVNFYAREIRENVLRLYDTKVAVNEQARRTPLVRIVEF